ncbi:PqqD family protein [Methanobacterium alcaliphilum]|uniref:PqqD family protein n=1 Tax=Methanobacterium alcaliphilum TaxID=392018 RepID=UPI002009E74C|nr:PqqD family protein [Methanobacterium alcaliphilum]MCK9150758.1 PqqD family protein [Methanobacterium alcaliphilum]
MITNLSVVSKTNKSVHCDLEDEVVILGLDDGVYYGLNPVGAFIWNYIQGLVKVEDIKDAILEEYDVEKDVCEKDLLELLEDLLDKGLIEVQE